MNAKQRYNELYRSERILRNTERSNEMLLEAFRIRSGASSQELLNVQYAHDLSKTEFIGWINLLSMDQFDFIRLNLLAVQAYKESQKS